ncbi:hypothetical protein B9Z55_002877 [Caenorhabditis nigoni]|uniref:Chitin-binding type-2 domain-containing protein n=1 Tax=Caenorhabditis nigoni TaxID=1611254 RepID=A0A2G5VMG8_9PELO|nr:hypothetical protein B9Z55_002877 [Caenorhabditis nigoni]
MFSECTTMPDGSYALDACASKYLKCTGGIGWVKDCPDDFVFNEPLRFCDRRHNVVGCEGSGASSGFAEKSLLFLWNHASVMNEPWFFLATALLCLLQ